MRTLSRIGIVALLGLVLVSSVGCGRKVDPRIQEGYDLVVANKIDEAVALANAILTEDPGNASARNLLGLALYKSGDAEGAVEQYRRALELEPAYAEAHFNLGNAYERLQRLQDAEASYAAAVRHESKFVLAHYNLANLYLRSNRREQAMTELRRCVELDPQFYLAYILLGEDDYHAGNFEGAIANLGRALELDPAAKELRVLLGNAYLQSRREDALAKAESEFRAAVGIDSTYVDGLYSLGMSLAVQGRNDEAAVWFRRVRPMAAQKESHTAIVRQVDDFFARTGLPLEPPAEPPPG